MMFATQGPCKVPASEAMLPRAQVKTVNMNTVLFERKRKKKENRKTFFCNRKYPHAHARVDQKQTLTMVDSDYYYYYYN